MKLYTAAGWIRVSVLLGVLILLSACGGGGGSDANTQDPTLTPAVVARVVITPGSVLLTGKTDSRQLTAQAYDANGDPLSATFTWTSTHPDQVEVDSKGLITSFVTTGSTQIIAQVAGVKSAPVLVAAATPAAGAVLVNDSQIVGNPELVDPTVPFGVGSQYRVTLTGVPAPELNTILLGTETAPVGGRVVDVQDNNGQIVVTLEMRPLKELFQNLAINETMHLSKSDLVFADDVLANYDITTEADGTMVLTPKTTTATAPAGKSGHLVNSISRVAAAKIDIGPFECESGVAQSVPLQITLPTMKFTPSDFDVKFVWDEVTDDFRDLTASGTYAIEMKGSAAFTAGFEGKLTCKKRVASFRIPVGGVFTLVFGGHVPLGVGFEVSGKIIGSNVGFDYLVQTGVTIDTGLVCPSNASCAPKLDFTQLPTKGDLLWNMPPELNDLDSQLKIEPRLFVFGYVDFELGDYFGLVEANAFGVQLGTALGATWATPTVQIQDDTYKSYYQASNEIVLGAGEAVQKLFDYLTVIPIELKLSFVFPLATSPTAVTATVDRDTFVQDDLLTFNMNLNRNSINFFPTVNNVEEVSIYRKVTDLSGNPLAEKIATAIGVPGQTHYTMGWLATEPGTITDEFFAYVTPSLMGHLPLVGGDLKLAPVVLQTTRLALELPGPIVTTGTLVATVTEPDGMGGMKPVSNMLIELTPSCATTDVSSGRTDAQGQLSVTVTPDANCTSVTIDAIARAEPSTDPLDQQTITVEANPTIQLNATFPSQLAGATPLTVTVQAIDSNNIVSPIADATVTFVAVCATLSSDTATTDAQGQVNITVTPDTGCTSVTVNVFSQVGNSPLLTKSVTATKPIGKQLSGHITRHYITGSIEVDGQQTIYDGSYDISMSLDANNVSTGISASGTMSYSVNSFGICNGATISLKFFAGSLTVDSAVSGGVDLDGTVLINVIGHGVVNSQSLDRNCEIVTTTTIVDPTDLYTIELLYGTAVFQNGVIELIDFNDPVVNNTTGQLK